MCPICRHQFQGSGWDGIDAHWRAKHESVMPYKDAWPLIQAINASDVSEMDGPEASYRRGYQQGAWAAFQATRSKTTDKIEAWLNVKLTRWRYIERIHDRYSRPPDP